MGILSGQRYPPDGAERGRRSDALLAASTTDPAAKAAIDKQIDAWRKTAARYESDPKTGEGRKELAARAKDEEEERDLSMAKYHHYEIASAAFQIGIVLASATVITGIFALAWFAGLLGVAGLAFWRSACSRRTCCRCREMSVDDFPRQDGEAGARTARLSAALRENLKRRKAQHAGRGTESARNRGKPPAGTTADPQAPDFRLNRGSD